MAQYIRFNLADDKATETSKVTAGYFPGGVGTFAGTGITTESLDATQDEYYVDIQDSSGNDLFSAFYANRGGSGSIDEQTASGSIGQTAALYRQIEVMVTDPADVGNGLFISQSSVVDEYVYGLVAERSLFKDRVNKQYWTIAFSGSNTGTGAGAGSAPGAETASMYLELTDDSATVAATPTIVGPRYNIVSGSQGTVVAASSSQYYGHFYPNIGLFLFSGLKLSASIPGRQDGNDEGEVSSSMIDGVQGFHPADHITQTNAYNGSSAGVQDVFNARKVALCLKSGSITMRSEEDQTTVSYLCHVKNRDFNFSNNPTFRSGSEGNFAHTSMEADPRTFITTVGLYNDGDELVAVGKLSAPIQNSYNEQSIIRVNLQY